MPTPFTHLEIGQRLLRDEQLSLDIRRALKDDASAFLLGSIAADALSGGGGERADTHFYFYDQPIERTPWRVMLEQYPTLNPAANSAHQAFLAGYVAHLAVDELWTMEMLRPHIAFSEWGEGRRFRFYVLNLMLVHMDERDVARLETWIPDSLRAAQPQMWTPFLDDETLTKWRDIIYEQIKPGGISLTLPIVGGRVGKKAEELRADLDSAPTMQHYLWDNVAPDLLADIEGRMYVHAREQLAAYWALSQGE
jgi:hypothetical protein